MSVRLGFKAEDIIAEGRVTNDEIKQIHDWLRDAENLPIISDEEIVNFLLSNDNDQENTKNTINAFFKIRNEEPDIFNNRLFSSENSELAQTFAITFIHFGLAPKRTNDNCAVIYTRLHDTSYQSFNLTEFCKFLLMTLDAAVYSSPPSGLIIVLNMDGFGLMHLTKLKIHALSILFRYLQEALPVKLKNIHILNTPYFINKFLAIMRPLMNDHLYKLIIFHKSDCNMVDFFANCVAREFVPEDYGGELPCMKDLCEQLIENLKDMESYFAAEEERRSLKSQQL